MTIPGLIYVRFSSIKVSLAVGSRVREEYALEGKISKGGFFFKKKRKKKRENSPLTMLARVQHRYDPPIIVPVDVRIQCDLLLLATCRVIVLVRMEVAALGVDVSDGDGRPHGDV